MDERVLLPLTQETIDEAFRHAEEVGHQFTYLEDLYNVVFAHLGLTLQTAGQCHNWPHVSKETSLYMFEKAIAFDKAHHPEVFAGGLWMNNGFSTDHSLPDWVVDITEFSVDTKEAE